MKCFFGKKDIEKRKIEGSVFYVYDVRFLNEERRRDLFFFDSQLNNGGTIFYEFCFFLKWGHFFKQRLNVLEKKN